MFNVVLFAFKTINGSKLKDLVDNPKEISSHKKYIRKLKISGVLDDIYKIERTFTTLNVLSILNKN
jgi:hypothetical protein